MTWVRLEDGFADHPKIVAVGPEGMALYVAGLCYSNRYLTDGFIPQAQVPKLIGTQEPTSKLVKQGLWEIVEGGYQIHDYDEYQPSRDDILEIRKARSEAGRKGGLSKPASNTEANDEAKPQAESNPGPGPGPVPNPVPDPQEKPLAPAARKSDPLFESVAEACGIDWSNGLTKQARGTLNAAVAGLRDAGATPDAVRERARNWPTLFDRATLTPPALAKHWPQLARAQPPKHRDRYREQAERLLGGDDDERRQDTASPIDQARRGLPKGSRS